MKTKKIIGFFSQKIIDKSIKSDGLELALDIFKQKKKLSKILASTNIIQTNWQTIQDPAIKQKSIDKMAENFKRIIQAIELSILTTVDKSNRFSFKNPNPDQFIEKIDQLVMNIFLMYFLDCSNFDQMKKAKTNKMLGNDLFQNYQEFYQVFTLFSLLIYQKIKKYPDHKTFYKDFVNQLKLLEIDYNKNSSQNGVTFELTGLPFSLENKDQEEE